MAKQIIIKNNIFTWTDDRGKDLELILKVGFKLEDIKVDNSSNLIRNVRNIRPLSERANTIVKI